jgi:hypothetical protein
LRNFFHRFRGREAEFGGPGAIGWRGLEAEQPQGFLLKCEGEVIEKVHVQRGVFDRGALIDGAEILRFTDELRVAAQHQVRRAQNAFEKIDQPGVFCRATIPARAPFFQTWNRVPSAMRFQSSELLRTLATPSPM